MEQEEITMDIINNQMKELRKAKEHIEMAMKILFTQAEIQKNKV